MFDLDFMDDPLDEAIANREDDIWTTADGETIHLDEMDRGRLENILVFLDKQLRTCATMLVRTIESARQNERRRIQMMHDYWEGWVPRVNAALTRRRTPFPRD